MNQWDEMRQYELHQRQSQIEKAQRLAKEQERKQKEVEHQYVLREQSRVESEHRLLEERRIAKQQTSEERQRIKEAQSALLAQTANELRIANQLREDAQRIVAQRYQEEAQVKAQGSPIEASFYTAWCEACPSIELKRQYKIGNRRVDFAHPETMTAIELDGHDFHSKKRDRTRDYQRQREIEDQGWFFVRFTGSEVFVDVEGCVHIAWNRIQGRMPR